jgi:glutathione S-transferase
MYTLAEIAILPYVDSFKDVRPELMTTHPRTREWHERVMARPAVRETYLPSDEAPGRAPR